MNLTYSFYNYSLYLDLFFSLCLTYTCLRLKEGNVHFFVQTKTSGNVSSGDWKLDPKELVNCFSNKTKAIVLNTPHNPLGKVFTLEELTLIADLCKKYNVLCISDEVYEWMVYAPYKHIRIG